MSHDSHWGRSALQNPGTVGYRMKTRGERKMWKKKKSDVILWKKNAHSQNRKENTKVYQCTFLYNLGRAYALWFIIMIHISCDSYQEVWAPLFSYNRKIKAFYIVEEQLPLPLDWLMQQSTRQWTDVLSAHWIDGWRYVRCVRKCQVIMASPHEEGFVCPLCMRKGFRSDPRRLSLCHARKLQSTVNKPKYFYCVYKTR